MKLFLFRSEITKFQTGKLSARLFFFSKVVKEIFVFMQNVELLLLSKRVYVIIAVSLPLRLNFTGMMAMPVLEPAAPIRLHKVVSVLTMPLRT